MPEGDPGLVPGSPAPPWAAAARTTGGSPSPAAFIQVLADGTPKAAWPNLPTAEPFAKDAALLHLLGVDEEGRLWFDLAVPAPTSCTPHRPQATEGKPEDPAVPAAPARQLEDWPAYVSQGLDRLYCWDPQKKVLQRFKWAASDGAAGIPETDQRPQARPALRAPCCWTTDPPPGCYRCPRWPWENPPPRQADSAQVIEQVQIVGFPQHAQGGLLGGLGLGVVRDGGGIVQGLVAVLDVLQAEVVAAPYCPSAGAGRPAAPQIRDDWC